MNAIEFENVLKEYKIYYGGRSLRKEISNFFSGLSGKKNSDKVEFQAVKNASFQIPKGATVGLIGSNGSGKSTILKLISKVTYPTSGKININGSVASLLEIGAGFHQDFTARENIFLNGALLGLSRKQIKEKFDEIVEFSELEKFIDTPVKKYSSGMYVKLGFSIAIHVDPEILLVDEVLSVGDANFQNKCIKKMREVISDSNRTVIVVSHNMVTIQALCDKALWFEKGVVRGFDDTKKIISLYSEEINKRSFDSETEERLSNSEIYCTEIETLDVKGNNKSYFHNHEEFLVIKVKYKVTNELKNKVNITLFIEAIDLGLMILSFSTKDFFDIKKDIGEHSLSCKINIRNICAREFSIRVVINTFDSLITYDNWTDSCRFCINDDNINMISGIADILKTDFYFGYE